MTTEAEALANILVWSADIPGWQRDAAISSVSRGVDKAGFCRSEPLFKARTTQRLTTSLIKQLAEESGLRSSMATRTNGAELSNPSPQRCATRGRSRLRKLSDTLCGVCRTK